MEPCADYWSQVDQVKDLEVSTGTVRVTLEDGTVVLIPISDKDNIESLLKKIGEAAGDDAESEVAVRFKEAELHDWDIKDGAEAAAEPEATEYVTFISKDDKEFRVPVEVAMMMETVKGMLDIGHWGTHNTLPGVKFLKGATATLADAQRLIQRSTAAPDADYATHPSTPLDKHRCTLLIQYLEARYCSAPDNDFQVCITQEELSAVVGVNTVAALQALFCAPRHRIKLRRVAMRGRCINLHVDKALRTMQIPLNDESEYDGGRLTFITQRGMEAPSRPAGSATIHDNTILHGVTEMKSGVRYSLFFLED